jgi:hypothetical protein
MIEKILLLCFLLLSLTVLKAQGKSYTLQYLDASIDSLVNIDAGQIVTLWKDISGNGYDAVPAEGNAIYPSSKTFDNGLNAIDMRNSRISLELLSAEESDTILNQATNPTGFCIITAVYVESINNNWNDVLGNNTTTSDGFFIRYSNDGKPQTNLGGVKNNGSKNIQPGQPVIFSFNYDADSGAYEYYCSTTNEEIVGLVEPADFSNDSPLTIGSTNGSERYFDGMLGEVQVYATSISKANRNQIIHELEEKWGFDLPRIPLAPNTRIVETKWSDSDVAMIGFNAAEAPYNADKTGATDATEAIQMALDDCTKAPGGVVYLPEGTYRIDGKLVLGDGVTLRGDWKEPNESDKTVAGTVLHIYGSKGEDSEDVNIDSPINIGGSGGIRDLTVFYPEQDATNPVTYPYTIRCESKLQTVMNVTLVNAYKGIRYEKRTGSAVGHPNVYNVYGSPLKKGIRLNKAAAVPRITAVDFDPAYWAESGLAGAPSESDILNAQRSLNSVGLEFEQSDNGIVGDLHLRGYDVAITIGVGGNPSNMKVYDFKMEQCRVGVHAAEYKSQGWTFTKGSIQVDGENAMAVYQTGNGVITFNGISFSSSDKLIISTIGSLSFTNCRFQNWQDENGIYMGNGHLVLYGNIFSETLESEQSHIYLEENVGAAAISGNIFENSKAKIVSLNTDTNLIVIDTTNEYKVYRHDYEKHAVDEYFRPAKEDTNSLFNVVDYGAVGDMETENTKAFRAALNAAEEYGGGTVYVPGGAYRIDGRLVIPTGVELRGVHDVPVYTGHGRSLLLSYLDKENPGDSAFVTMQEGSGIRGLVLVRPQQVYNEADSDIGTTIYDWPFVIRATGDNCSITNTVVANADKGVDLASSGGGHHLNWYMTAPIRMCLDIQTGVKPVVINNMQTNPGLFRDIKTTMNWNVFSDNIELTGYFKDKIAFTPPESRDLFPSGTASNIKGDGEIVFYSNFYNNPFNGFIINGSPQVKSYLSGGEGEIFYTVESEGTSPVDLQIIANTYHPIESDPAITGFGSYQLKPNSSGTIKVLNTTSFGAPNVGYRINNGNLIIQSAYQTVTLQTFVEAKGSASVSVEGSYLHNGMSQFHGVARNDSIDLRISGSYSDNNYRVSSAVDVSGSTPLQVNKIDVIAPSTPLDLQAEAVSSSQINLSWGQSGDNMDVAGYYVYRDGIKITEVNTTNYSDEGLSAETYYDYFVTAYDEVNNESLPSDTVSVSTAIVGVADLKKFGDELIAYPNPAKDQIYLSFPNTNDAEVIFNIYSVSGVLFQSKLLTVPDIKAEIRFDVSSLEEGLYIYQLIDSHKTYTGKIYINK